MSRTWGGARGARWSSVWSLGAAALGAVWLSAAPAEAQDRKDQPRVIELDEDIIKGRVQKPEAFYILQHASLNYERLKPRESFIPELVESVKEEPF